MNGAEENEGGRTKVFCQLPNIELGEREKIKKRKRKFFHFVFSLAICWLGDKKLKARIVLFLIKKYIFVVCCRMFRFCTSTLNSSTLYLFSLIQVLFRLEKFRRVCRRSSSFFLLSDPKFYEEIKTICVQLIFRRFLFVRLFHF